MAAAQLTFRDFIRAVFNRRLMIILNVISVMVAAIVIGKKVWRYYG
jgi:hypothetical protein